MGAWKKLFQALPVVLSVDCNILSCLHSHCLVWGSVYVFYHTCIHGNVYPLQQIRDFSFRMVICDYLKHLCMQHQHTWAYRTRILQNLPLVRCQHPEVRQKCHTCCLSRLMCKQAKQDHRVSATQQGVLLLFKWGTLWHFWAACMVSPCVVLMNKLWGYEQICIPYKLLHFVQYITDST